MGRLVAVILLIQISLPGFCCIANRAVRSTARFAGFVSPDGELSFLSSTCCGGKCCIPDSRPSADCCIYTDDCVSNSVAKTVQSSHSDASENGPSERSRNPSRHKLCECLESDPMLPPSAILIDLEMGQYAFEISEVPIAISSSHLISTARYHPPPLRRHLYLCVIRC
jgi:hypothetical protein